MGIKFYPRNPDFGHSISVGGVIIEQDPDGSFLLPEDRALVLAQEFDLTDTPPAHLTVAKVVAPSKAKVTTAKVGEPKV